jgi:protein-tyrosine phosphatase
MLDFHNHLMPAVDDGAQDLGESLAALRQMHAEGVTDVIVTPHLDGSLTVQQPAALAERMELIDEAWRDLLAAVAEVEDVPRLARGVELKLDTPQPDVSDERLRLAGTWFVLVEFPFMALPPHSARAIVWLRSKGYIPIIAHPERYRGVAGNLVTVEEWRRSGAYLQVNCGSLLGRYGPEARQAALSLLKRGWIDYLASDHHARGTLPHRATIELLTKLGGAEQAHLLLVTNPRRVLEGAAPLPATPLAMKTALWSRIAGVFR